MIRFDSDYGEGAHPKILEKLNETNMVQTPGYGGDSYCEEAAQMIKGLCKRDDLDVHFLVGGTLTNLLSVTASLRYHQSVIAPTCGHIFVMETGAIEAAGHKIHTLPEKDGKITASQIDEVCEEYWSNSARVHFTQPKLVYITQSTEYGTLYKKAEIAAIAEVCRKRDLYLYIDGARLGYGMASEENDADLPFLAEHCDIFYIGGNKQGMLFGEAIIIKNREIAKDFRSLIKQRGGLLAKGRLLGIQFSTLLADNLYIQIAKHANSMADLIRQGLKKMKVKFFVENTTNLLFVVLPLTVLEELSKGYAFTYGKKINEKERVVRISTSWATKEENVQTFLRDMERVLSEKHLGIAA
ncbi:MAG: low specificity L-threonine aldolase [Holosporales bacterium]|jgi:threonine aldolase|nr:low specificity L-threonine aldolase [Holosporales bacterium]